MCYGTTGDEKCICFSLKLIMARVRMVFLSPKKHLRCLCELSSYLGKGGPGKQHIFCPVLKALCPWDEGLEHLKAIPR